MATLWSDTEGFFLKTTPKESSRLLIALTQKSGLDEETRIAMAGVAIGETYIGRFRFMEDALQVQGTIDSLFTQAAS
jgi:hypothetical protein